MDLLIIIVIKALDIYLWLIIASVIASWLIAFEVLNLRNKWVYKAYNYLHIAVEPPMAYVRRVVPAIGGLDLSPMVVIFGIYILQSLLIGML